MTQIPIANAAEATYHSPYAGSRPRVRHRGGLFLMWFGQSGTTHVYVWADGFESAFEEAVEWLDDQGFCGFFTTLTRRDFEMTAEDLGWDDIRFRRAWKEIETGRIDSGDATKLLEKTEADLTIIGHTTLRNCEKKLKGGPLYVPSYEWGGDEVASERDIKEVTLRSIEEADLDPDDFSDEISGEFE